MSHSFLLAPGNMDGNKDSPGLLSILVKLSKSSQFFAFCVNAKFSKYFGNRFGGWDKIFVFLFI